MRRSEIETWIIDALQRQLMAPDLVAEFVRAFNEEINRGRRDRDRRREALLREQKDLDRRIDSLLDAVASGDLLEAFEERKGQVAEDLAGLVDEPVRLPPNLADAYRRKVASLQTLLQEEATRTEAVEVIRSLIAQIVLRPTAEGRLDVELVGDLPSMVHLAAGSPGAAGCSRRVRSFGKSGCGGRI